MLVDAKSKARLKEEYFPLQNFPTIVHINIDEVSPPKPKTKRPIIIVM